MGRPYKQNTAVQAVPSRAIAEHGYETPKRMVFPYLGILSPCKAAPACLWGVKSLCELRRPAMKCEELR